MAVRICCSEMPASISRLITLRIKMSRKLYSRWEPEPGRAADLRHDQAGAGPVVELAVGDAGGAAGDRPAEPQVGGQRREVAVEQQALGRPRASTEAVIEVREVRCCSRLPPITRTARPRRTRQEFRGRNSIVGITRERYDRARRGVNDTPSKLARSAFLRRLDQAPESVVERAERHARKLSSSAVRLGSPAQAFGSSPVTKSSGLTWSRNSRNFSTSSSSASGISIPASSSTSSAQ